MKIEVKNAFGFMFSAYGTDRQRRPGNAESHVLQQRLSRSPATDLPERSRAQEYGDAMFTTVPGRSSQAENKRQLKSRQPASKWSVEYWIAMYNRRH